MSDVKIYWSYSALSTFENCPRKYWATKVAKVVSDINTYNLTGDDEHKALEFHMSKGLALPPTLHHLQPLLTKIKEAPGEQYVEYAMCLKKDLTPTRFKDFNEGWVRGAGDYVKVNGTTAVYFDWKSGKPRGQEDVADQTDLVALLLFRHFPQLQKVNSGMVYYRHGKIVPNVTNKSDEPRLWNGYMARVRAMEDAKRDDNYPATPNPLCGWCPYKACPHNTQDARLAKLNGNT